MSAHRGDLALASGILCSTLAVYIATNPGRIDIIDAQSRYEVAVNWLLEGQPFLRDPIISFMGVPGNDGLLYGFYGAAGSVFSMPLITIGLLLGGPPGEITRFLFSFTSSVFGALTAALLYLFYRQLEVHAKRALLWTAVAALTTLLWPGAVSTFDNAQHAFFVLASAYLGYLSAVRKSRRLAAIGGLAAGTLFLYQEYFLLVIPALAISTLELSFDRAHDAPSAHNPSGFLTLARSRLRLQGDLTESAIRYLAFSGAAAACLILWLLYNDMRFGSWLQTGKTSGGSVDTFVGNPGTGLLTLLVSPGKSVFLYSPPLVLGFLGIGRLWRDRAALGTMLLVVTAIVLLFFSCIRFVGGDWCWGPRYLMVLMPLWALAFPFASLHTSWRKRMAVAVIGLGLFVQLLAISVEHQRFFFARGLNDWFWAEDSWIYFKRSALFARPAELASLVDGPPSTAKWFSSVAKPGWATYTILGPVDVPRKSAPEWMRQYQIYFLPRPWPLWMWWIDAEYRPVDISLALAGLLGVGAAGAIQIHRGLRDAL